MVSIARVVVAALGLSAGLAPAAERVTLHPDELHQTIQGWGTCLYDDARAREAYRDERFLEAYRDAGFNIVRIPMVKEVLVDASGDFSKPVRLTDDLEANLALMDFHVGPLDDFAHVARWLGENGELPVKIVGSVWTPPHWMKGPTGLSSTYVGNPPSDNPSHPTPWLSGTDTHWNNGRSFNNGNSIGGRLRTEDVDNLEQYGRYLASWVKGFEREQGLTLFAVSLQNESTFENPFDSMTLGVGPSGQRDLGQYALALEAAKDAWREFGVPTKVMGPHVAGLGPTPENPFKHAQQIDMIQGVRDHPDPELLGFLSFYNANYYVPASEAGAKVTAAYLNGTEAVPADWGKDWGVVYRAGGVAGDGKPIWFSETGDPAWPWRADEGGGAVELPIKVFNALVHGDAVAYVYWQMLDGGEDVSESTLIGTKHLDDPIASKKYAAMCQFSKFIPPCSRRISATFAGGNVSVGGKSEYDTANGLSVAAFETPGGGRTIVLLNMAAEAIDVDLPDDGDAYTAYLTNADNNLARFDDRSGVIGIPAASVVTLVRP